METLTSSCPPGFDLWGAFMIHVRVLVFFSFLSWLDLSFLEHFDSFFFIWDELGCELIPSTVGFHLIPHEFIDRGESSSRGEKLGFVTFSCFPLIGFVLGDDLLGVAYQFCGDPLCKVSSHSELIWSSFGSWIIFSWELLVNTRHVRYECRTCPVGQTFEFGAEIWWRPTSRCLEVVVKISYFLDTI